MNVRDVEFVIIGCENNFRLFSLICDLVPVAVMNVLLIYSINFNDVYMNTSLHDELNSIYLIYVCVLGLNLERICSIESLSN